MQEKHLCKQSQSEHPSMFLTTAERSSRRDFTKYFSGDVFKWAGAQLQAGPAAESRTEAQVCATQQQSIICKAKPHRKSGLHNCKSSKLSAGTTSSRRGLLATVASKTTA